jgi:predicted transcriptional regulator with HTH domain
MFTEEDFIKSYFTESDITGMTHSEFQVAMIGLIEKGLMEEVEVNGKKMYRPTPLLRKMKTHSHSNPKDQN